MSTGEQRKFLLARSLVNDPAVLVFDEPTSGLDMSTCFQYLEIIRELISMGKKVILVTHHIHEIPPEVTRVILLKEGRVIEDGDKDQILTNTNLTNLFDWPIRGDKGEWLLPGNTRLIIPYRSDRALILHGPVGLLQS